MKLIQAYVSLYVCKYVFLPPSAPADLIESGGYGNCKILTVDLPTVSKHGMEFLFAKFWLIKNVKDNDEKFLSLSLPHSLSW